MGQAFRRASGRIRASSSVETTSSASKPSSFADSRPPVAPAFGEEISKTVEPGGAPGSVGDGSLGRNNAENLLEDRDPKFDVMLNQMVGRITTKPGGKQEMGEAFVVEKYNRPLPKLRNTNPDSGRYEERPSPVGTLNVAQLRHIILLHQGKADDYNGPMDVGQIAEKFRVNVAEVQRILQFVTLPPEDTTKEKHNL
ncbi:hypothetical protein UlMin_009554 [Ulmus minor]